MWGLVTMLHLLLYQMNKIRRRLATYIQQPMPAKRSLDDASDSSPSTLPLLPSKRYPRPWFRLNSPNRRRKAITLQSH